MRHLKKFGLILLTLLLITHSVSPAFAQNNITVAAIADPSEYQTMLSDPFAYETRTPHSGLNKDLYLTIYKAIQEMKPSVDVSKFELNQQEKWDVIKAFIEESGYFFFYMFNIVLSEDGQTAYMDYMGDLEKNTQDQKKLSGRLQHLLYNVALDDYSQLEKFIAVFDYICQNANYGSYENWLAVTSTPFSVLVDGQGICIGYSKLMEDVLSRRGLNIDSLHNVDHAWNIVQLDGKWYQSDLTSAAGYDSETANIIDTLLMDDIKRDKPAHTISYLYPWDEGKTVPACTDTRFSAYYDAGSAYTFDFDNGKTYLSPKDGITRMNMDGTQMELLLPDVQANLMTFFDNVLYYIDAKDKHLYRMQADGVPELMDDENEYACLMVRSTKLLYGEDPNGKNTREIELLPCPEVLKGVKVQDIGVLNKADSYRLVITLPTQVKPRHETADKIYMLDERQNVIPVHVSIDAESNSFIIRPQALVENFESISLYMPQTDDQGGFIGWRWALEW